MPGAVIVRSDVERKALFGVDETEKLRQMAYTDEVDSSVSIARLPIRRVAFSPPGIR